jgi:hypothetical protein
MNGEDDSANNDVLGHDMVGRKIIDMMLGRIQEVADQCTGCGAS